MDALDIEKAYIVGHDWGSQLAWAFAGMYPDRTLKLVAISVGHPSGYMKGDHRGEQKQKSWYIPGLQGGEGGWERVVGGGGGAEVGGGGAGRQEAQEVSCVSTNCTGAWCLISPFCTVVSWT